MNRDLSWEDVKLLLDTDKITKIRKINKAEVEIKLKSGRELILMATFQNRIACVEVIKEQKDGQ